jgi:hypothetical protein
MELSNAILTPHALEQLAGRGVEEAAVREVLKMPLDVIPVRSGRVVAQAMVTGYLLRVFVDIDRDPPEVVTAYRTSKVEKYRRQP